MLGASYTMPLEVRVGERRRIGADRLDLRVVGVVEVRIDRAVDGGVVRHRDFPAEAGIGAGQEGFRSALGKARTGLHVQLVGDVVVRRAHEREARLGDDVYPSVSSYLVMSTSVGPVVHAVALVEVHSEELYTVCF